MQTLDVQLQLRLDAKSAGELARVAKIEARGERPNLSATARRAIREYVKKYQEARHESAK